MKISFIFIFLHFTSTFSFPQFGGIFGEVGGKIGFTCLGGKKCYNGRRRKRSTVEISEKLNTIETIPGPNNMEISPEADTVEISQEPVNVGISQEPDIEKITVKPDSVKTSEYPYLVPFTFPSSDERSINLFPFGLSFPWFSFSSSIQHKSGEKISAESDQDTVTQTPGEESTAPGTLELSQESDTVAISSKPDTEDMTVKPDTVETLEYPYLVQFTFPSSNKRSFNLVPFGLGFPWFSSSSSIKHNPGEKISAESDQETQTRTPGEESTAPESVSEYSVPAWFQSPTNVSLHKFLFPFGSSFPFDGR